jgi:hypothetical protein
MALVGSAQSYMIKQPSTRRFLLDAPGIRKPVKVVIVKSSDAFDPYPAYDIGYDLENPPDQMSIDIPGKSVSLMAAR